MMLALPLLKLQIRCSPDIGHRLCCLPPSTCFCGKSISLCNSAISTTGGSSELEHLLVLSFRMTSWTWISLIRRWWLLLATLQGILSSITHHRPRVEHQWRCPLLSQPLRRLPASQHQTRHHLYSLLDRLPLRGLLRLLQLFLGTSAHPWGAICHIRWMHWDNSLKKPKGK